LAVGSLAGALIAARRRARPSGRLVVGLAITFGLIEIATGLAPSYLTFAAMLPVMGFVTLLTMTAANASIQLGVDPGLRGRVMALYIMVLMGGTPIGSPILGWLGETLGPRWTLLGGGAATVLGVVASVVILRIHLQRQGKQIFK
jgi:MFS family permease